MGSTHRFHRIVVCSCGKHHKPVQESLSVCQTVGAWARTLLSRFRFAPFTNATDTSWALG